MRSRKKWLKYGVAAALCLIWLLIAAGAAGTEQVCASESGEEESAGAVVTDAGTSFCIESEYESGSVRMEILFPLQQEEAIRPRAGRDFAVSVTVAAENTEFSGSVNVLMQNTGENHVMFSERVPELAAGEDFRTSFVLPMETITEGLYFSLTDGNSLRAVELAVAVDAVNYGEYKLIGVLSEQPAGQYEYFTSFGNRVMELTGGAMAAGAAGLDSLDIIVAEESVLQADPGAAENGDIREILREWVAQGKTLVVGASPADGDEEEMFNLGLQDAELVQELVLQISNYEAARNSVLATNNELKKQNGDDVRTMYIGDPMIWPMLVSNLSDEAVLLPVKKAAAADTGDVLALPESEITGDMLSDQGEAGRNSMPAGQKAELTKEEPDLALTASGAEIVEGEPGSEASASQEEAGEETTDSQPVIAGAEQAQKRPAGPTGENDDSGITENASVSAAVRWDWWSEGTEPEVVWRERDEDIITKYSCGAGTVLVFRIPLGREQDSIYPLFYYRIVQLVLGNLSGYQSIRLDYERYGATAYGRAYMLEYIDNEIPGVSVLPYLLLLLFYIGAVIPAVFLMLRHRQRSKYLWGALPVAAVLMTGAIYLAGGKTRVREPYCSYIDLVDYTAVGGENGEGTETVYFRLSAPTNQGAQILVPVDVETRLQGDGFLAYNPTWADELQQDDNIRKAREYRAAVYYGETENVVSLENVAAFSNTAFRATRRAEESGGFTGAVLQDGEQAAGTVRNMAAKDWKNVFVVTKDQVVYLGSVKQGEETELSGCRQAELPEVDRATLQALVRGRLSATELQIVYELVWAYAYELPGFVIAIPEEQSVASVLGEVAENSHSRGVSFEIYPLQEEGL